MTKQQKALEEAAKLLEPHFAAITIIGSNQEECGALGHSFVTKNTPPLVCISQVKVLVEHTQDMMADEFLANNGKN